MLLLRKFARGAFPHDRLGTKGKLGTASQTFECSWFLANANSIAIHDSLRCPFMVAMERAHRIFGAKLRCYISNTMPDWDKWIQIVEFIINNTTNLLHG